MKRWSRLFGICLLGALLFVSIRSDEEASEDKDKDEVGTVIGIDLGTTYSW